MRALLQLKTFLSGSTFVSVFVDSTTHADEPYLDLLCSLPHHKLLQNETCYLKRNILSFINSCPWQFRNIFHDQNCLNKITTPIHIKWTLAGLFIYLCIKYKLVKECGKKFPSVHNKRKGKGWKRALTSNSTVETRYQASPSSNVEKQIQT